MTARLRGRFVASALITPLFVLLAGCGGSSNGGGDNPRDEGEAGAANAACGPSITKTASTPLPSDIPLPDGAGDPYEYFAQGATKVWNLALDGTPGDLSSLRDSYDDALKGKGYEIEGTDAEEGFEAESEFRGPHEGTTNFRPLCKGKVVLRIKLSS
jgi:hypothetical protein